ncbi:mannose-1-phosphate guanylyltransferase/mannose-6-phosphate isomerase, partial [Prochlorococcus sp. HOT_208_60]
IVESNEKLIYGLGLHNLIIIQSDDATLIIDQNKAEKVKDIVKELSAKNISEGRDHKKIYRPWGNYISISEEKNWKVKVITVLPGQSLSLQKHFHRSEHWVVVKGNAKVEIDNRELTLKENESTYIPSGSIHRLSNPLNDPLKIIEVQSGSYLEEDDIIRLEDNYGRN